MGMLCSDNPLRADLRTTSILLSAVDGRRAVSTDASCHHLSRRSTEPVDSIGSCFVGRQDRGRARDSRFRWMCRLWWAKAACAEHPEGWQKFKAGHCYWGRLHSICRLRHPAAEAWSGGRAGAREVEPDGLATQCVGKQGVNICIDLQSHLAYLVCVGGRPGGRARKLAWEAGALVGTPLFLSMVVCATLACFFMACRSQSVHVVPLGTLSVAFPWWAGPGGDSEQPDFPGDHGRKMAHKLGRALSALGAAPAKTFTGQNLSRPSSSVKF